MFPYKIRKPAWGSFSPNPKATKSKNRKRSDDVTLGAFDAASHLGGDPKDSHTVGGNLQKAILLDLIELRQRYFALENLHEPTKAPPSDAACASAFDANNLLEDQAHNPNQALGCSFSRFKSCFREARLGAIHTRTIPPRVDRGEYVQLLYSSCLYLLEESSFRDETSSPISIFNAIFAVFSLYALHKTNTLPEAPPSDIKYKSGEFDEQYLQEAWTMLPVGINSDEDKMFRRTFHSGVRIDRWSYLLLLKLRDVCLARLDQCAVEDLQNATNAATLSNHMCGMERDAAHVIDKMLFNDSSHKDRGFFQYCEYHGPHSLEGLAGSPHFYRTYFAKPPKKYQRTKVNDESLCPPPTLGLSESELSMIGNGNILRDSLDLQALSKMAERHCSDIFSVLTQLQAPTSPCSNLKPKQRELVEKTLGGVMEQSTGCLEIVNTLGVEKRSNTDVPRAKDIDSEQQSIVAFPETFPSVVCDNVRDVLFDFREEANKIRKAVVKEKKVSRTCDQHHADFGLHSELDFFDYLADTAAHESNLQSANVNKHKKRNRQREHVSFLELQQEGKGENDQVSIESGNGRSAFTSLLSMTQCNNDDSILKNTMESDEISTATGAGKNALLTLLSMVESNTNDNTQGIALENGDQVSVATGDGMNALRSLLNMAGVNENDNLTTGILEKNGEAFTAGVRNDTSLPLQSMPERSNLSEPVEERFVTREDSQSDVVSLGGKTGKRALEFRLMQYEDEGEDERKDPEITNKRKFVMQDGEVRSSKKKNLHPARSSVQTMKSNTTEKQPTADLKNDEENSTNSSAQACDMYDDFSVATDNPGKNALDLLLASAT